ncbi:MAG TPA: hypothetical protein VJ970_01510 [Flavobacteriaceae bacterium]|nr:hypothetical protein [Flavobacteriaceae bacterium]
MKKQILILLILSGFGLQAQELVNRLTTKKYVVKNDTVLIDSVSITNKNFKVFDKNINKIDTTEYNVNFEKAILIFKTSTYNTREITIQYTPYPTFLTQSYFTFPKRLIVPNNANNSILYSFQTTSKKITSDLFKGLDAAGNINRGITVGNNQNAVVNSMLDLQIAGQLSKKVTLKASIVDTNIPIQESGNTYELKEFDRIFITLESDKWKLNAGDIYLNNSTTKYLNFNKKVSGLQLQTQFKKAKYSWGFETSGAIVKGKYNKVEFTGIEGNQGPYPLSNFTNKYILILSGTEKVYVNGKLLKRGENNDYIIDYNTAEIIFNTTFPVISTMRIKVEYQYNDREYTRFTTYNGVNYKNNKLNISTYFYNESDLKNQSLSENLTNPQKQILANAGNNSAAMVSPSAQATEFSEDKILYKKVIENSGFYYEYSTNETDSLYTVSFLYVGNNLGDYSLKEVISTGKIYEYVGENLGNYKAAKQLIAPEKLQLAVIKGNYAPTNKTDFNFEAAVSNSDLNLFSSIDDDNNVGFASKIGLSQVLLHKQWEITNTTNFEHITKNFKSVERIQQIEFNRDWNLENTFGKQQLLQTSFNFNNAHNYFNYTFENLNFGENYAGYKHLLNGNSVYKNLTFQFNGSTLQHTSTNSKGNFIQYNLNTVYDFSKKWIGVRVSGERNALKATATDEFNNLSHDIKSYETYFGVGDSTAVFTEIGAKLSVIDSVKNNRFKNVSEAKTFYLKSNLINSEKAKLRAYVNYRLLNNEYRKDENSLNSQLIYQQFFAKRFFHLNTKYETLSGNLPKQDYTYLKTAPGQGFYTWNDYNNNNIKELNEFEIAQFADEAEYLRVILPTISYLPTHQIKFTQTLSINPQLWNTKKDFRKILANFYNQTFILIDNKQLKTSNTINLNPFDFENQNNVGLNYNFNNSLYFNRGKKYFTTVLSYQKLTTRNTSTIDIIENKIEGYKLNFTHLFKHFWEFNFTGRSGKNQTHSQNYNNRNFKLNTAIITPKINFNYNNKSTVGLYYSFNKKSNKINNFEELNLHKIGLETRIFGKNQSILKADFNYISNKFKGDSNTPVGYQMLEGLQPGENYTWSLLAVKKLSSLLHLNLNYLGRKSENSNTIHTGSIQLKAIF